MPIFKKIQLFIQGFKFILVGLLNTAIDFGALNLLMFLTKTEQGFLYSLFKGISFSIAVINSYFWNKYWTFNAEKTQDKTSEIGKFLIISIVGFLINVGVASLIVNLIGAQLGIGEKIWANLGAMAGTGFGMVWNFVGYKLWAFKKQDKIID